jgi:phage shock protein A
MWRLIRAFGYLITGRFSAAAAALQGNQYVMAATYDSAIEKSGARFTQVRDAVASLMGLEQTRLQEIKTLSGNAEKLTKVKEGAKVAMQKRVTLLLAQGKTREDIEGHDAEFIKHLGNYKDASSSLEQTLKQIHDKEKDLDERKTQIAQYKAELQRMQKDHEKLRTEKQEALADVAIAKQQQAISDVLNGIAQDTTDKDLQSAREARKNAQAKAKISAELAGNDAKLAESEYLQLASSSAADKELDSILNWGEDANKSKLEDAKLIE